jgi:hypothetical protein
MDAPLEVGDAYLVVVAVVLTWVISFVTLIAYRAYVRKLIATLSQLDVRAVPPSGASASETCESSPWSRVSWTRVVPREDGALYDRATLRRRGIARDYTLAAAVYAVIASLMLLMAMDRLSVMTLVTNTWVQAWPLMLTLDVLDGGAARWRRIGRYLLVLLALGGLTLVIGVIRGRLEIAPWPMIGIASVGLIEWAVRMILPTAAILPTLHRSVREVAPIVFIVMLSALAALRSSRWSFASICPSNGAPGVSPVCCRGLCSGPCSPSGFAPPVVRQCRRRRCGCWCCGVSTRPIAARTIGSSPCGTASGRTSARHA